MPPACPAARVTLLVGRGLSLRRASEMVRLEAHRYAEDGFGMRYVSRQCELAARYLDVLGGEIDRALAPARWPRILVLDSKPLGLRAYGAAEHGERWDEEDRAGAVLVAVGGDDPALRLQPWRIGLAGDETAAPGASSSTSCPASPPGWWPTARRQSCRQCGRSGRRPPSTPASITWARRSARPRSPTVSTPTRRRPPRSSNEPSGQWRTGRSSWPGRSRTRTRA